MKPKKSLRKQLQDSKYITDRLERELDASKKIHESWLKNMEPMYQFMVEMSSRLGIDVRNPIEITERLNKIKKEFNKLLNGRNDDSKELKRIKKKALSDDLASKEATEKLSLELQKAHDVSTVVDDVALNLARTLSGQFFTLFDSIAKIRNNQRELTP